MFWINLDESVNYQSSKKFHFIKWADIFPESGNINLIKMKTLALGDYNYNQKATVSAIENRS